MSDITQAALTNAGATVADLSDGQTRGAGAPAAPVIENKAPTPELTDEQKAAKQIEDDAAAAEAATKEKEATKEVEPVVTDYVDMQDDNLNAVVDILKDVGLSPAESEAFFGQAVETQDPSKIDWNGLKDKVGATKAVAIKALVERYHTSNTQETQANTKLVSEVHEMFGGEAGFGTVAKWAQAKEKRDPKFAETLNDIREDIANGSPRAVKAAAKELLALYNGAPNTKGLGNTNVVKGEGKVAPTTAPLSRAEYAKLNAEAQAKGDHAAIGILRARRMAGISKGI